MLQFVYEPKHHALLVSICLDRSAQKTVSSCKFWGRKVHTPIYSPCKCIRRQETHGSRQQSIHRARQQAVAEEQEAGYETVDIKFGVVKDDTVEEDPE